MSLQSVAGGWKCMRCGVVKNDTTGFWKEGCDCTPELVELNKSEERRQKQLEALGLMFAGLKILQEYHDESVTEHVYMTKEECGEAIKELEETIANLASAPQIAAVPAGCEVAG